MIKPITIVVVILATVAWPLPLLADRGTDRLSAYRVNTGMEVMRFHWAEYLDDGFKLLGETGWLLGLTYEIESLADKLGWRHGAGLFFGRVDYDGHTWSMIPVKTDVWYVGTQAYMDATFNFRPAPGVIVRPFSGIGGKTWLRMLDDTRTAGGVPVNGVDEWWWSIYARAGVGARWMVSDKAEVFAEAGMKLPLHAQNNAYINGWRDRTGIVQYQTRSPFGTCGLRYRSLTLKLTYESLRFDRSDPVTSGPYVLYQPRSKEDTITMRAAWSLDF